jgi:putative endonuclease
LSSENRYYVYIMASRSLNLYTGATNSICKRALRHKSGEIDGFTRKYNINRLAYYETFEHIGSAIAREKQVKAWTRAKRLALIKAMNPTWQDLAEGWGQQTELQIPRFARDDNSLDKARSSSSENKEAIGNAEVAPLHTKNKIA